MNAPKLTVFGYVCGPRGDGLEQQRTAIASYAEAEGLTLAEVLHDESDACTISQLVEAARLHDAARVVLPAGVRLAEARQGIDRDLAERDAICVVLSPEHHDPPTSPIPVLAGSRSTEATP